VSGLALRLDCPVGPGFRLRADCELPASGVTAIHGPSGSGKTTLLDCIAGLRTPAPGSAIRFRGEQWLGQGGNLPPWRRSAACVFQDGRLFPHLDVRGNLRYALKRRGGGARVELEQAVAWLELGELLERSAATLSAGEKQRVAIARALLAAPRLLLLDEPLANLDRAARQLCLAHLQRLKGELDLPMLYVSHDIEEVSQLADHLVLMEAGRVAETGSLLDLCGRLGTRLSREEQAAAILVGTVRGHDEAFELTELTVEGEVLRVGRQPHALGSRRRLRVPARDVSICRTRPADSSILNILPVTLAEIDAGGTGRVMLRLALGSQYLLARITRKSAAELGLAVGDALFAQIKSVALLSEEATPGD